jgi:drug/metabolite transporter (DMT)-like permease
MINGLMLAAIPLFSAINNVLRKEYNNRAEGTFIFNAAFSFFAFFLFLFSSLFTASQKFTLEFLPYSFFFSLSYILADLFCLLSIREGPISLTSLMISFSTIIPALYGILFLKESVTIFLVVALVLLCVCIVLINIEKRNEKKRITPKWLFFVFLAFFGNGMCSVVQKEQQLAFDGNYKNEFMMAAMLINVVVLSTLMVILERNTLRSSFKPALIFAAPAGFGNGLINLFVMILSASMAASILFPVISATGIVASFIVGAVFYKEKFSAPQLVGVALGLVSVVLFSL